MSGKVAPRVDVGLAIIGPYGNIWTDRIFDTPEEAIAYLNNFWPEKNGKIDLSQWSVVSATQTISVDTDQRQPDALSKFTPAPSVKNEEM